MVPHRKSKRILEEVAGVTDIVGLAIGHMLRRASTRTAMGNADCVGVRVSKSNIIKATKSLKSHYVMTKIIAYTVGLL